MEISQDGTTEKCLLLRELQRSGRLAFDLYRHLIRGVIDHRYFVTVLVAALIQRLLHLGCGVFIERKCL